MSSSESEDDISVDDVGMFAEPEDFRPPPPPAHFVHYDRTKNAAEDAHGIERIELRLVGKSPLWGHLLWNAGIYTANYIDSHASELVKGKNVVEFGSAHGLPSLLACIDGANKVVATDYPDADLLETIQYNVDHLPFDEKDNVKVEGFIWGNETDEIRKDLVSEQDPEGWADLVVMSDLVFNHTEHHKLLKSAKELIRPLQNGKPRTGGKCLVVWSPHRPKPQMVANDFKFFEDAAEMFDFDVEKVEMVHWDHPMFPEDPKESEELRKRVYCYILHPTW